MGQLQKTYFELVSVKPKRFELSSEHDQENNESGTSKRDGYRLIFDMPPRMDVAEKSIKESRVKDFDGVKTEAFNSILGKTARKVNRSRHLLLREGQCSTLISSRKRSPLNGFLCGVIAFKKRKGE